MPDDDYGGSEVVRSFLTAMQSDYAAAYANHFISDARVRFEAGVQSPIPWDMREWHCGVGEIVATAKLYADMGMTVRCDIHDIVCRGPVVIVDRTDHSTFPELPDRSTRLVGVFVVINGRIAEWTDFYAKRTADGAGTD